MIIQTLSKLDHQKRCFTDGHYYHVGSRLNDHGCCFWIEAAAALFLQQLERVAARYPAIEVLNYCLMPTHFHLLIHANDAALIPTFMQALKQGFALRYNRLNNHRNHLWGERYFANEIESEADFWQVMEYIDNNPVKAGLTRTTFDWKWSCSCHIVSGKFEIVTISSKILLWYHNKIRSTLKYQLRSRSFKL
jgi:putative transposase